MNRQVVSSTVLTQSYSISLHILNTIILLIHSSIRPNGQEQVWQELITDISPVSLVHLCAWTDG